MTSGGTSDNQAQQPEMLRAVRVQSSTYGGVRPLVWGTTRITGNLIWYGDFVAIPQISSGAGGK